MTRLWAEYMAIHRACDPVYRLDRGAEASWARWVRSHLGSPRSLVLVAEQGGHLAGFCHAEIADRPPVMKQKVYGTIMDMAVTRKLRRSGVGTLLFRECAGWFEKRRIGRVELRVFLSNPLAVGFWRRMGFRPYIEIQYRAL